MPIDRRQISLETVILKALDATTDAIYLVDRTSMELIHVNDAACRMQGVTRAQLIARGPMAAQALSKAELERIYDNIIATGRPAEPIEIRQARPDGAPACHGQQHAADDAAPQACSLCGVCHSVFAAPPEVQASLPALPQARPAGARVPAVEPAALAGPERPPRLLLA